MATKTGSRTMHMAISLDLFDRMDDTELPTWFDGTAIEVREYLKELRGQGYKYLPCHCGNYDEVGRCKGVNAPETENPDDTPNPYVRKL